MINAASAKALSDANNPDLIERIMKRLETDVTAIAKQGKTTLRTYGLDGVFGASELYNENTPLVKEVITRLISLGYKAKIMVECKQFVDIYLEVSWA